MLESDSGVPDAQLSKHNLLLNAAFTLFNRHGYKEVKINQITSSSGVAESTFYRYFSSKEDLIVAVLERHDANSRVLMQEYVERASDDPKERVLAMFDFLETAYKDSEFYGCHFMRASVEYRGKNRAVFNAAYEYSKWTENYLLSLLGGFGLKEESELAQEINILYQGANLLAFVKDDPKQVVFARVATQKILDTL